MTRSKDRSLSGTELGVDPHATTLEQQAATRAVLWRVDRGLLTAVEAYRVLEDLGLVKPATAPRKRVRSSGARKTG